MTWIRWAFAALIVAGHIADTVAAAGIATLMERRGATYQSKPCWFELTEEQSDGRRLSCGEFVVPEHWDKIGSRRLHLPIVTFHAKEAQPSASPVLFVNGGPGGRANIRDSASIERMWTWFLHQQPWTAERDLVVISLRGTNWTDSNLECPELRDPLSLGASPDPGKTNRSPTIILEASAACLERLAQDHDLSGYNIDQNARDIAALRIAMGVDRWSLFGVSYGTRLALTVMRDYPEGIESAVLDSVASLDLDPIGDLDTSFSESLSRVFQTCHDHEDCGRTYPDSEEQLTNFLARAAIENLELRIDDHPEYGRIYLPLSPSGVIQSIVLLAYSHELIGMIPAYISALHHGHDEELVAWVASLSLDYFGAIAEAAFVVQSCNDDFEDITNIDNRAKVDNDMISREWLAESIGLAASLCERFATDPLPTDSHKATVTDIPTLLLSGYFDAVTPASEAVDAAKTLVRSYRFTFQDRSHAVMFSSSESDVEVTSCPAKIMTTFLDNPQDMPSDPCLKHPGELKFHLPR